MTDKEPLKITLADLGEPEPPFEPAVTPAEAHGRARQGVEQVGHKVAGTVKDAGSRVAQKITDSTADTAARTAEAVREKVGEAIQAQSKATADAVEARLREIDWKGEVRKGAEGGLHWLSERLEDLAGRLRAEGKDSKQ
jgi:hypothetical protein